MKRSARWLWVTSSALSMAVALCVCRASAQPEKVSPQPVVSSLKFPRQTGRHANSTGAGREGNEGEGHVVSRAVSLPLVGNVLLKTRVPRDWQTVPPLSWDVDELQRVPGAKQIESKAWKTKDSSGRLPLAQVICVGAPVERWSTGAQEVVFERLDAIAREQIEKLARVDEFQRGEPKEEGFVTERGYTFRGVEGAVEKTDGAKVLEGDGDDEHAPAVHGVGKHLIGFTTEDVLVCSALCIDGVNPPRCSDLAGKLGLEGPMVEEPSGGGMGGLLTRWRDFIPEMVGFVLGVVFSLLGIALVVRGMLKRRSERRGFSQG